MHESDAAFVYSLYICDEMQSGTRKFYNEFLKNGNSMHKEATVHFNAILGKEICKMEKRILQIRKKKGGFLFWRKVQSVNHFFSLGTKVCIRKAYDRRFFVLRREDDIYDTMHISAKTTGKRSICPVATE